MLDMDDVADGTSMVIKGTMEYKETKLPGGTRTGEEIEVKVKGTVGGETKLSGGTRNLDEASMENDGLTQGMKSMEIYEGYHGNREVEN